MNKLVFIAALIMLPLMAAPSLVKAETLTAQSACMTSELNMVQAESLGFELVRHLDEAMSQKFKEVLVERHGITMESLDGWDTIDIYLGENKDVYVAILYKYGCMVKFFETMREQTDEYLAEIDME